MYVLLENTLIDHDLSLSVCYLRLILNLQQGVGSVLPQCSASQTLIN